MMRSLYSAVSGLKNHQTKMDVIGNNISNVNTVAFKSSSVTFSDIIYQTISSASGATANVGGVNAKQIGLGVNTAATSVSITTAGAAQTTGGAFDIRLTDKGNSTNFFVVNNGSENLFTRAGSFYVDGTGTLCMSSTGYKVMGWQVDPETNDIKKDTVSALTIMQTKNLTSAPEATTNAYMSGIVDKNTSDLKSSSGYAISLNFYDNEGYLYTAKFALRAKDVDAGTYTIELDSILDANNNNILANYTGALNTVFGASTTTTYDVTNNLKQSWTSTGGTYTDPTTGYIYNLYQKDGETAVYAIVDVDATTASDPNISVSKKDAMTVYRYDAAATTPLVAQTLVSYYDIAALNYGWTYDGTNFVNSGTSYNIIDGLVYSDTNGDGTIDTNDTASSTLTIADIIEGYNSDTDAVSFAGGSLTATYTNYTVTFSTADGSFVSVGDVGATGTSVTMNMSALGDEFADISIDFSALINEDNSGTSTASAKRGTSSADTTGAGKKLGALTGITVESSGKIYGSYDNGNTVLLGQIAVAQFANASGLEKVGESCYRTTLNSGEFDGIGVEISADGSAMTTGELEMSNVDLSTEFTDMITTQRGFQANSRVITTSDSLLEELINLKR